ARHVYRDRSAIRADGVHGEARATSGIGKGRAGAHAVDRARGRRIEIEDPGVATAIRSRAEVLGNVDEHGRGDPDRLIEAAEGAKLEVVVLEILRSRCFVAVAPREGPH